MRPVIREARRTTKATTETPPLPKGLSYDDVDLPILFEDEGQDDMGDTRPHGSSSWILFQGIEFHLADQAALEVLINMNLYYHPEQRKSYVSPDVMVVRPTKPLPKTLRSYRIGRHGPTPLQAIEVLSQRSFQQQDLTSKPIVYHKLGVAEYVIVDVTGMYFEEKLEIWKRTRRGWHRERYRDGGITSDLGFRIIIDDDGDLRVLNAKTGHRYRRPGEAEQAAELARQAQLQRDDAEARVRELEAELARLRGQRPNGKN